MGAKPVKIALIVITGLVLLYYLIWYRAVEDLASDDVKTDSGDFGSELWTSGREISDVQVILSPKRCSKYHSIVLIVTSYVGHVELRSAHRRAYPTNYLKALGIKRVFLTARIPNTDISITAGSIEDESNRFRDIVQGDFIEAYRNLTYKHLMGLKWAGRNCPYVHYIIKMDDDIVFNVHSIIKMLKSIDAINRKAFLMGYAINGMRPIRLKANKWFVTNDEYRKSIYPPFLSGWMYITTPEVAETLVKASVNSSYFWIDDVFVTGILAAKSGIKLTNIRHNNLFLEHYELLDCCLNDMLVKGIVCEYGVGPNGNHDNMIVDFVQAIKGCKIKGCVDRPADKPLNKTCVSVKSSNPNNSGNAVVNVLKL